jgi:hypothetical protein
MLFTVFVESQLTSKGNIEGEKGRVTPVLEAHKFVRLQVFYIF